MLVAAPERWDETCFSVPAVRALLGAGVAVSLLCPEEQELFWKTIRGLRVIPYAPKTSAKALVPRLVKRFEAAILWEAGVGAEASMRAEIRRRTGPSVDKALGKFLTDPMPTPEPGPVEHRVRHYLALVEAFGVDTRVPAYFEPADLGIRPEPGTVLLVPDSDFGRNHEWPLDRWESVARELLERGCHLTVAGMPDTSGLAAKLAFPLGEDAPKVDLPRPGEWLPLLAAHERVIAADGSLPHLAAYAGATCVVLFGPNEPAWKRPMGKRHIVVRRHVECSPCLASECAMDLRCQTELNLQQVLAAIRRGVPAR
jgi:heptosyltransferase-2